MIVPPPAYQDTVGVTCGDKKASHHLFENNKEDQTEIFKDPPGYLHQHFRHYFAMDVRQAKMATLVLER